MELSKAQMSEVEATVGEEDLPEVHESSFWCCTISVAMLYKLRLGRRGYHVRVDMHSNEYVTGRYSCFSVSVKASLCCTTHWQSETTNCFLSFLILQLPAQARLTRDASKKCACADGATAWPTTQSYYNIIYVEILLPPCSRRTYSMLTDSGGTLWYPSIPAWNIGVTEGGLEQSVGCSHGARTVVLMQPNTLPVSRLLSGHFLVTTSAYCSLSIPTDQSLFEHVPWERLSMEPSSILW